MLLHSKIFDRGKKTKQYETVSLWCYTVEYLTEIRKQTATETFPYDVTL